MVRANPQKSGPDGDTEEALNECSKYGYQNSNIVNEVKEKAKRYRTSISNQEFIEINIGVLVLLDAVNRLDNFQSPIIVFDFGGAYGIYYLQLRKCLNETVKILWCVIETPEMVNTMKEFETNELKFYSSIQEAKKKSNRCQLFFIPQEQFSIHQIQPM